MLYKTNTMDVKIISIKIIKATDFSEGYKCITLDDCATESEMAILSNGDDSIIFEF